MVGGLSLKRVVNSSLTYNIAFSSQIHAKPFKELFNGTSYRDVGCSILVTGIRWTHINVLAVLKLNRGRPVAPRDVQYKPLTTEHV